MVIEFVVIQTRNNERSKLSELRLKGLQDDRIKAEEKILKSSDPKNHNSDD